MLDRLRQYPLTTNPKKCVWGVAVIEYLRHKVGSGKVNNPELRVKALKEFMTKKSNLGMLGYYRTSIPGFSSIALPLTEATKLKSPSKLSWTQPMESAFVELKDPLCQHTQLTIPSPEDAFILSTDASGQGVGAVLSIQRAGQTLPVAYFSQKLFQCLTLAGS